MWTCCRWRTRWRLIGGLAAPTGLGSGLVHLRESLRLQLGSAATLHAGPEASGPHFRVELRLPWQDAATP